MTRTKGGSATPVTIRNIDTTDAMRLADADGNGLVSNNGLLGVIDGEHYQIHEGNHFFATDIDSDVDIASPKLWLVIAPPSKTAHLLMTVHSSKNGTLEIFEAPTTTDDGTAVTAFNNDRRGGGPQAATLQVLKDPTVSDNGTLLFTQVMGDDSTSGKGTGGPAEPESELIVNESTKYLIKYTSLSDNNRLSIDVDWYEVGG